MIGTVGERMTLSGLKLIQKSWYEKDIKKTDRRVVYWRYCFVDPHGERVVYAGEYKRKWMHLMREGETYTFVATIKRHDTEYDLTRIMRPVIVTGDNQGKLL